MQRSENTEIIHWLKENFTNGKDIIDIGAKKGKWFRNLRKHFPHNKAYIFEPIPNNLLKVKKTLKDDNNVTLFDCALSNKLGNFKFYIDLDAIAWSGLEKQKDNGNYKEITVDVKTLDSFNFNNIGFIKIDVEGNELFTLKGSVNTINQNKPIIYFECADVHLKNYNYASSDLYLFFTHLNYKIYTLDQKEVTLREFEKHSYNKSSFYHNFLAVPQ
jgi:FkbM family methyltransferase